MRSHLFLRRWVAVVASLAFGLGFVVAGAASAQDSPEEPDAASGTNTGASQAGAASEAQAEKAGEEMDDWVRELLEDDDFLEDPNENEEEDLDELFGTGEAAEGEEESEEERPRVIKNPYLHWGFNVPVDVLILRPLATVDVLVGGSFFAVVAPFQGLGALADYATQDSGSDRYMEVGNLQQAWQQTVSDPLDYLVDRPLGQLTNDP